MRGIYGVLPESQQFDLQGRLLSSVTAGCEKLIHAWQFVSRNCSKSLICAVAENISLCDENCYVCPRGLDSDRYYRVKQTGQILSGSALQNIGLLIPHNLPQYSALVFEPEHLP